MRIDCLAVNPTLKSKRRALEYVASRLAMVAPPSERLIFAALVAREGLGSTGLGGGIALPHALLDELEESYSLLATLKTPLDFEAADRVGVTFIFALIAPGGQSAGKSHVPILSQAARLLRDPEKRRKLARAEDEESLAETLAKFA